MSEETYTWFVWAQDGRQPGSPVSASQTVALSRAQQLADATGRAHLLMRIDPAEPTNSRLIEVPPRLLGATEDAGRHARRTAVVLRQSTDQWVALLKDWMLTSETGVMESIMSDALKAASNQAATAKERMTSLATFIGLSIAGEGLAQQLAERLELDGTSDAPD